MGAPKSGATPRDRPGAAGEHDGPTTSHVTGREGGELAAVERLRVRLPAAPPGEVWIGDDTAVLRRPPGPVVLTTDLTVSGVHGDPARIGLADLGWRALARAVSDVAAMGARPDGAVVAVAGPPDTDLDVLYDGVSAAADAHGCPVVGGDLSTANELVIAVTVQGHVGDGPPAVLRSGARAGDALFVTGPLGGASAGLRALVERGTSSTPTARGDTTEARLRADLEAAHRRPRARLAEGEAARRAGASAMIDVSDGLLLDLGRLADASGVGFALEAVPVFAGATLQDALGGGDDYELVVAHPDAAKLARAFAGEGLRAPVVIGSCVADTGARTLHGEPTTTRGFEHPWN